MDSKSWIRFGMTAFRYASSLGVASAMAAVVVCGGDGVSAAEEEEKRNRRE